MSVNPLSPGKYSQSKTPRIFVSTDKRAIAPQELNQLSTKAGLPFREPNRLKTALENSQLCVTARKVKDRAIVGFLMASGDGVFNLTVWDLIVDPDLPNQEKTKILLLERLKQEIKRSFPRCTVSVLARAKDLQLFRQIGFVKDCKGIRPMVMGEDESLIEESGETNQVTSVQE